ncbi:MAG: DMT family transporter [Ottowia sp.]|nr:DMT family transporter [Ottowia sp.]
MTPDRDVSAVWHKTELDVRAASILLACCLFWGIQQVLIKATLPELPPIFQSAVRFSGATLLLWLWCRWRGVRLFQRDGSLWAGLLVGLLFAGEFAAMYLGLQRTTASRLTIFLYTSPFWVALVLPLFVPTERFRPLQWVGLVCAFAAVTFAFRDGLFNPGEGVSWQGDLLGLGAGMLWGLTTVAIRSTSIARLTAEKALFYQVGLSAAVLPLLSLGLGETWNWNWSWFAVVSVFLQTAVGAFATYLAWMWLLVHYSATKVAVFVFLTPVFALAGGMFFLHEPVTPGLLLALALVAVGIMLVNYRPPRLTPGRTRV